MKTSRRSGYHRKDPTVPAWRGSFSVASSRKLGKGISKSLNRQPIHNFGLCKNFSTSPLTMQLPGVPSWHGLVKDISNIDKLHMKPIRFDLDILAAHLQKLTKTAD